MNIKDLQERLNTIKRRIDPEILEKEKRIERRKGMVKGFAIGGIIAGVTALFLSPDNGRKNRKRAKEELEKIKDILETNVTVGKKKLIQVYEDTKEIIEDKKGVLTEKLKSCGKSDDLEEYFEETEEYFEDAEEDSEDAEEDFEGIGEDFEET